LHTRNNKKKFVRWVEWNGSICTLWFYMTYREGKTPIFDSSVREFHANSLSAFRRYSERLITHVIHILYAIPWLVLRTSGMSTRWPFSEILSHTSYNTLYTYYNSVLYRILCIVVVVTLSDPTDPFYWKTTAESVFFLVFKLFFAENFT